MTTSARAGLPGVTVVRPTAGETIAALAADLGGWARGAVAARGVFHLALSGGSTPDPLYHRLAADPASIPWAHTHVWLVDERAVPEDDGRCNWRAIARTLLDPLALPAPRRHPMRAHLPGAAAAYERDLRAGLGARPPAEQRLDAVLLGMGADGHTASLFPRSAALVAGGAWVLPNDGPSVTPPARVTLTAPFLSTARTVAVLVLGAAKRDMLARIAAGAVPEDAPIRLVAPPSGLRWYLDTAAAPAA